MKTKEKRTRPLFLGRPCRFKNRKAYDRAKEKQIARQYMKERH